MRSVLHVCGRYAVGMWSVRGRHVVGMWSVSEGDRYVVGREGGVLGKWSVRNCEWPVALFIQQQTMKSRVVCEYAMIP